MSTIGHGTSGSTPHVIGQTVTDRFALYHGDTFEVVPDMPEKSVDFWIFSPPFVSLYTYSNSPRDAGNCRDAEEFAAHFSHLPPALLRATKPGRLCAVHCMLIPRKKEIEGVIGLRDFRGDLIRLFEGAGWIFHSEVCIWKDPVIQMQRTKAHGLLHKTVRENATMSRQGLADYLLVFRAPGEVSPRVMHGDRIPVPIWQRYASPVWMDIDEGDTLQRESARDADDERHICPLQLGVIRRAIDLWTAPGDVVGSPFAGIGSEGFVALQEGRRFVGVELKDSYYRQAAKNLAAVERPRQASLFDAAPVVEGEPQPQPAAPVADRPGVVRALPQEAQEQPASDAPAKPAKAPRKPRAPKEPKAAKAPRGTTAVYIPGETTDAKAGAA